MKLSARPKKPALSAKAAELRAFGGKQTPHPMMHELYRRAATHVRKQRKHLRAEADTMKSTADPRRLLHELQVHQVELELQNTELQEARNQMEVLLEKYTDLYDFAPAGYLSIDDTGAILEANLMSAVLLGVERSRLINRRLPLMVSAASRPGFLSFLKKMFAGNKDLVFEAQLLKENGASFWTSFQATPAVVLKGAQKWGRVVFSDITARKQVEEALQESEERFRALFELGPVAVYSCDAAGVIQKFNRRAVELWGREPAVGDTSERFCGSFKMFRPDGSFLPHRECPMAGVLKGKISETRDAEVLIERPDGSRVSVLVNIRPLKRERGKITGAINCFYDITERKRAEEAQCRVDVLAASNSKLEQEIVRRLAGEKALKESELHQRRLLEQSQILQEQLRQLSHQVLHAQEEERKRISRELHDVIAQTLTGINIRLSTLKRHAGSNLQGFDRDLARTQQLVEKSVDIVHQFARELRPAVLDDLGLVPALHTFMKDFTTQTGIRAQLTAFTGIEKLDTARRTVLFRVAQEALTNVARHAHASRVEVIIHKLPRHVSMKIKDNGRSFNADRAMHANSGKRLGLLGMRERLEMVGGIFGITSAAGKGTTVEVQIPFSKIRGGGAQM